MRNSAKNKQVSPKAPISQNNGIPEAERTLAKPIGWRRFEKQANGCWVFQGTVNNAGYGQVVHTFLGKRYHELAHRAAYEELVKPIPKGLTIDHRCGNKLCVNPCHLEPVTQAENNRRSVYLRRKPHSKVWHKHTAEQHEQIRKFHKAGLPVKEIAKRYDLTPRRIQQIIKNK